MGSIQDLEEAFTILDHLSDLRRGLSVGLDQRSLPKRVLGELDQVRDRFRVIEDELTAGLRSFLVGTHEVPDGVEDEVQTRLTGGGFVTKTGQTLHDVTGLAVGQTVSGVDPKVPTSRPLLEEPIVTSLSLLPDLEENLGDCIKRSSVPKSLLLDLPVPLLDYPLTCHRIQYRPDGPLLVLVSDVETFLNLVEDSGVERKLDVPEVLDEVDGWHEATVDFLRRVVLEGSVLTIRDDAWGVFHGGSVLVHHLAVPAG